MSRRGSLLLGFLIAPATPAIPVILIGGYEGLWWATLILPISYVTSALIGLPIHIILRQARRTTLLYYVLAGLGAALLPIFFIFFLSGLSGILPVHFRIMGLMMVTGMIVSGSFWMIARPDRQSLPETSSSGT